MSTTTIGAPDFDARLDVLVEVEDERAQPLEQRRVAAEGEEHDSEREQPREPDLQRAPPIALVRRRRLFFPAGLVLQRHTSPAQGVVMAWLSAGLKWRRLESDGRGRVGLPS